MPQFLPRRLNAQICAGKQRSGHPVSLAGILLSPLQSEPTRAIESHKGGVRGHVEYGDSAHEKRSSGLEGKGNSWTRES